MGYIYDGELRFDHQLTEEAKQVVIETLSLGKPFTPTLHEAGIHLLIFEELAGGPWAAAIEAMIERLEPMGYGVFGSVRFSGDGEGVLHVTRDSGLRVFSGKRQAVLEAPDDWLVEEMTARGYSVKKAEYKKGEPTGLYLLSLLENSDGLANVFHRTYRILADAREAMRLGVEAHVRELEQPQPEEYDDTHYVDSGLDYYIIQSGIDRYEWYIQEIMPAD